MKGVPGTKGIEDLSPSTPKRQRSAKNNEVARQKDIAKRNTKVDEALLIKLASTMLTLESIANILGVSRDTLHENFSDVIAQARDKRREKLSEALWAKALEEKNTSMQIWLSKQHLGYVDSQPLVAQQMSFNVVCNEVPSE